MRLHVMCNELVRAKCMMDMLCSATDETINIIMYESEDS